MQKKTDTEEKAGLGDTPKSCVYDKLPHKGHSFEEDGLRVYWNFCGNSGEKIEDELMPGHVCLGLVLLEVNKVDGIRCGKWAFTTAKTPEEYAVILHGTDAFQKYQLMLLASERRDNGLARQVLEILKEAGVREVLIETATNPYMERADREGLCDRSYGLGNYKDRQQGEKLVREISLVGELEKLAEGFA